MNRLPHDRLWALSLSNGQASSYTLAEGYPRNTRKAEKGRFHSEGVSRRETLWPDEPWLQGMNRWRKNRQKGWREHRPYRGLAPHQTRLLLLIPVPPRLRAGVGAAKVRTCLRCSLTGLFSGSAPCSTSPAS